MVRKPTKKEWMQFASDIPDSFVVNMLDEIKPEYLDVPHNERESFRAAKSAALAEIMLKRKVGGVR